MRQLRAAVLIGLAVKLLVLAVWWRGTAAARAEGQDRLDRPDRPAEASAAPDPETGVPADLFARSRGFRDLLEAVHQRTATLDERESGLVAREAAMKALEKTLAGEIVRLEALSKGPGAPGAAEASAAPTLPSIYATMKPEEAGPILDRLDDATVKGILKRMGPLALPAGVAAAEASPIASAASVAAAEPAEGREPGRRGASGRVNVQIATEFIDPISTQRSFQANARVVSTGDTMLNDLR